MFKNYLPLFILFSLFYSASAQKIEGKVLDTLKQPLSFVSVSVINHKDSVMVDYGFTNEKGEFSVQNRKNEKTILQINQLGFQDYQEVIPSTIKNISNKQVILKEASTLLNQVIVKAVVPVRVKKDTVAISAKAFKVQPDEVVEDLLQKVPGVSVEADGSIKSQGETITKIYVDGKLYFSSDPKVVSKNLSADAIKSIEIIDEKSKEARVTGVDDTEGEKVLNLKLKEDKKQQLFGKIVAGYGTDNRRLGSVKVNRFSGKQQLAVITKHNNINQTNKGVSDLNIDAITGGASSGIYTTSVGAANYGYQFKKERDLYVNYIFSESEAINETKADKTEFVEDESFKVTSLSNGRSNEKSNKLKLDYEDESSKGFSVFSYVTLENNTTENLSNSTYARTNADLVEDLTRTSNSVGHTDTKTLDAALEMYKVLDAKKRSIKIEAEVNIEDKENTSSQESKNGYDLATDSSTLENEFTDLVNNTQISKVRLEAKYTEPLSEQHFLIAKTEFNTSLQQQDYFQDRISDVLENNLLDYLLTNKQNIQNTLLGYKYSKDRKLNVFVGAPLLKFQHHFGTEDQYFVKEYLHLNPRLNIRYKNKQNGLSVRFELKKNTKLPSINQINPIVNNFNPLRLLVGNPNLNPERSVNSSITISTWSPKTNMGIYTYASYNNTADVIVNNTTIDATGTRTRSYINYKDKTSYTAFFGINSKFKETKLRYNIRSNARFSEYYTLLNSQENKVFSQRYWLALYLLNEKNEHFNAQVSASVNYDITDFSLQTRSQEIWSQNYKLTLDWNIVPRLQFFTNMSSSIVSGNSFDDRQVIHFLNSSITYSFLKQKNLRLKVSGVDILNQNLAVSRASNEFYIQESKSLALGTYYMLSMSYDFK